jgi:hypothetical protein
VQACSLLRYGWRKKGDYVEGFWIIGIVVNLLLTGLAIYWIVGQVKAGRPRPATKMEGNSEEESES